MTKNEGIKPFQKPSISRYVQSALFSSSLSVMTSADWTNTSSNSGHSFLFMMIWAAAQLPKNIYEFRFLFFFFFFPMEGTINYKNKTGRFQAALQWLQLLHFRLRFCKMDISTFRKKIKKKKPSPSQPLSSPKMCPSLAGSQVARNKIYCS